MNKIKKIILYFIRNMIITIFSLCFLLFILGIFNIEGELLFNISAHTPILVQLIITAIVCFNKWKFNFNKILFTSTVLFTVISIIYNLNFTTIRYLDDYLPYLVVEEIIFQIYLVILVSIFAILKKIKKRFIIYNFIFFIPIPFSLELWLLYIFNPVLIFILTSVADGDLLVDNGKENKEN